MASVQLHYLLAQLVSAASCETDNDFSGLPNACALITVSFDVIC